MARTGSCGPSGSWWRRAGWHGRRKADLVHSPATLGPAWTSMPTVITIHDMLYWSHPELMTTPLYTRPVMWMEKRGAANAARVITDSQVSADEIVKYLGFPRERLHVVLLAAEHPAAPRARGECREPDRRQRTAAAAQELGPADRGARPGRGGSPATAGHHRGPRRGPASPRRRPHRDGRLGGAARVGGRRRAGRPAPARPRDGLPDAGRRFRAADPRGHGGGATGDRLGPAGAPGGRR